MKRWIAACVLAGLLGVIGPARGAEEQMSRPPRSESLELPGLTAGCHVCEWRPKLNQKAAVEQCGTDEAGQARIGIFECGFSEDCQRVCHFIRCGTL
ncbi:MAG TPA: hypothetical protein VNM24_08455 [Burkholderiales bacterium]|nr:hypothetical protein [Burkholderiales bacterium]